jgi:hypothetical protein
VIDTNSLRFQELLQYEKDNRRSPIHSFHRYFGKLIPAIPAFAIKNFTVESDWVCDPFAGSGTTLVEARLNNRNALGFEINPISCFISKVKTTPIDTNLLMSLNRQLLSMVEADHDLVTADELPYCYNREHWFWSVVQKDLVRINRNINRLQENAGIGGQEQQNVIDFYRLVLSSIIRNVSNADTQHVFPGYSKRLRRIDAEGKREIDVRSSFRRALIKKTKALEEYSYPKLKSQTMIVNADARDIDMGRFPKSKLIVTNPPYISSIRYIETMKLELYWMEYILNRQEYKELEERMIGCDRLRKADYAKVKQTPCKEIDAVVSNIFDRDPKSGIVAANYFNDMYQCIKNMNRLLSLHGVVVMKISDSKLKKIQIETGKFLTDLALTQGFELIDSFIDKIENRSLLTARNAYSDIITHDHIVIWEKVAEASEF